MHLCVYVCVFGIIIKKYFIKYVWTSMWYQIKMLQTKNKQNLTRENLGMAKKGKPLKSNGISSNSSTKQPHKD